MGATATTATDTDMATTVLTDTATDGTERGQQMLSQSPLLPLSPRLMLMPGTVTTATVATDTAATTGLMATMATMGRGMLMPGTATTATDMGTTATDTDTATTAHTDMPTGAKQAKREVDSSSDCDFSSTLASISRACA